jgi:hypothetical protein
MKSTLGGYASERYARSLRHFGRPLELTGSGAWILVREIGRTGHQDAMGCYPLLACPCWAELPDDLDNLTDDGLSRFKRGWATGTRTAYLCGRVLDRREYERMVRAAGAGTTAYFPAYRTGEFG